MGIYSGFQQCNGEGTDRDMRQVSGALVRHGAEGWGLSFLFLTGQMESDSFSHVCREQHGSQCTLGSLAYTNSGRRDGYHQVTCSDGLISLSWSSISLLRTLCKLYVEHDQDGGCAAEFTF
jgi:hypothetical protein